MLRIALMQASARLFATAISKAESPARPRLSSLRHGLRFRRMFELDGIDHVALAVSDVARSADWYVEVLGFERRFDGMWNGVPTFIGKGRTALALFPTRDQTYTSANRGERFGMLHLAFRATRAEFAAAQRELRARGISFAFQDHEISHSIYFNDPDGIKLEITTYELDGAGSPFAGD